MVGTFKNSVSSKQVKWHSYVNCKQIKWDCCCSSKEKQSSVSHKELEAGFMHHLSFLSSMTSLSANGRVLLVWWCHVSPIRGCAGQHCSGLQRACRGWFSPVLHMNSCVLVSFIYTSFYWPSYVVLLDVSETHPGLSYGPYNDGLTKAFYSERRVLYKASIAGRRCWFNSVRYIVFLKSLNEDMALVLSSLSTCLSPLSHYFHIMDDYWKSYCVNIWGKY